MKASEPIQRFINHIEKEDVLCTNTFETKKHESVKMARKDKKEALQHAYIEVNQKLRRYMIMDIDREAGALAYEDIGLEPTIILTNPVNTHAHLLFELEAPVRFTRKGRVNIQNYYQDVLRGMTAAMQADFAYSHNITKNPLSDRWRMTCCDVRYSLGDITEYCKPLKRHEKPKIQIDDSMGRNCTLFNTVRYWAYFQVKSYVIFAAWNRAVLDKCEQENSFSPDLPYSEVKATAKSIAKWTWNNRHIIGYAKNRGAAQVDKRQNTSNRQKAGADYTNQLRKQKTEQKIIQAIHCLKAQECKLTIAALTEAAEVSRRTLYNYRSLWEE
jgi:hypothetical protein